MSLLHRILPALLLLPVLGSAQGLPALDTTGWLQNPPHGVLIAPSPLKVQVIFAGGRDSVLTPHGMALSKGRNDYVTFVPITPGVADSGYVCINHETIVPDSLIGDGGGMTILKVVRDGDSLRRVGPARAVDFRPVGGTHQNCGGITSPTGRVWSGEESWRPNNISLNSADTADVILAPHGQAPGPGEVYCDIPGNYSGRTLRRFQNHNYMVEIDPVNAVAIRKQYNWGRMSHEGGAVLPDNRTVILSPDAAPCYLPRFVADTPDDFSAGTTYAWRQPPGQTGAWHVINNSSIDSMLRYQNIAAREGCALFARLEWSGEHNGKIYLSETGRDDAKQMFRGSVLAGAHVARHHLDRMRQMHPSLANAPDQQVEDSLVFGTMPYTDYYGRILEYDPSIDSIRVYLEGGPAYYGQDPYPAIHFSNPDALAFLNVNGRAFMLLAEDLIGSSMGRIPPGSPTWPCEVYMLDMSIPNPSTYDLVRLAVVARGAEATGTASTPDGKTVFFCSQHPSTDNDYPYNYSVTLALSGWDQLITTLDTVFPYTTLAWPVPVQGVLNLDRTTSGTLHDAAGHVVATLDRVRHIDCTQLPAGMYILRPHYGGAVKFVVGR